MVRQQDNADTPTRDETAWALRKWSAAVIAAEHSDEAEVYADALELVLAFLDDRQTVADLINAYTAPS